MLIFSPTATPCGSDVVNKATLSCILKIIRLSLRDEIETIFDPVLLTKSELVKNKVLEILNVPVKTLTFKLFCLVVVSRISPVATGALTPSLNLIIAPFVYEELVSKIKFNTLVSEDSTSVLLNVPDTSLIANFLPEITSPTILPVAPVTAWVIVSPSKMYAVLLISINNDFVACDSIDVTVLPLTESTSPDAPYPPVPVSSTTILPPTLKLFPLLTIVADDTVPLLTSLIVAYVLSPFLPISELLYLFALIGKSYWDILEL